MIVWPMLVMGVGCLESLWLPTKKFLANIGKECMVGSVLVAKGHSGHVEYTLSVDIGCMVVSPNRVRQTVDTVTSSGSKMRLDGQGCTSIGKGGW